MEEEARLDRCFKKSYCSPLLYYFLVVVVAVVIRRLSLRAVATIETENASPAKRGMYELWGKTRKTAERPAGYLYFGPSNHTSPPPFQGLTLLSFIHHPARCCC